MAMGGVGEAALLGAAMGGGSALLTGRDPLQGALMGTLTGGIGGAVSPALSALTTAAPAVATTAATSMAPTVANAALLNSAQAAAGNAAINGAINTALPLTGDLGIAGLANSVMAPAVPSAFAPLATGAAPISAVPMASATPPVDDSFLGGMKKFADNPLASLMNNKFTAGASALAGASAKKKKEEEEEKYSGPLSRFKYNPGSYRPSGYADGGITSLGAEGYDRMVGEQPMYQAMARGGIADLGSYSDGGRMLKGPGDGMSDNIPATIADKRPARLADGEFVIPADVVSHLGNGSSDAGAKQLYAMMDKVRKARTGRKAQGREINPRQYMAA
jgi:hypothetical protein